MDSPLYNGKIELTSIFKSLKLGIYLSLDKNKVYDWLIALAVPTILIGPIFLLAFCFFIIRGMGDSQELEIMLFIASIGILPFWFVAMLGMLYSFNLKGKLSYDQIYVKGFKLLFPFLWLALLNIFIILTGFCLFIIPGIFWGIRYSLSIGALIFEDERGFQALSRSKALAEKHFLYIIINYAACGAIIWSALKVVLIFSDPQFGLWTIIRLFIILYAVILASAIYYCMFQQLSTGGQFTMELSAKEKTVSQVTQEAIIVGIVFLIFSIVILIKSCFMVN